MKYLLYKEAARSDGIGNHWLGWGSGSLGALEGGKARSVIGFTYSRPWVLGSRKGGREMLGQERSRRKMYLGSRSVP